MPSKPEYHIKRKYAYAPQVDGIVPEPNPTNTYDSNNPITLGVPYEDSNLVTSLVDNLTPLNILTKHAPCIDIDAPCELIPSSQLGHYHLYIHKEVGWVNYRAMLKAMADAGIVEKGYYKAASHRGYSSLRHIGQHKPGLKHPGSMLLKENALLRHELFLARTKLEKLQAKIDSLEEDCRNLEEEFSQALDECF